MFGGAADLTEKYERLCSELNRLSTALEAFPRGDQEHSRQYREWARFKLIDGGNASAAGAITVGGSGSQLYPCANGWEAYLTSIAITVQGASSAATVAIYNGDLGDGNLLDYASNLFGNSPSRLVAFYDPETVWVSQEDALSFVFASTAASAPVQVVVNGKRRQV